jgi:cytochrome b561/polyisoprenoid-binding protein YceI
MLRNTQVSYGSIAKTLHWVIAALILAMVGLGFTAERWPIGTSDQIETKFALFSLHKTIGVTVLGLALLRIGWAAFQPRPVALHPERRLESWAARTVHFTLYALLVLVPLSGWLHHSATSGLAPIRWPFAQRLPFVPEDEQVSHFFSTWHFVLVWLLIATVGLHLAGTLKHLLADRDATLRRMLPGYHPAGTLAQSERGTPVTAAAIVCIAALGLGSYLGLPGRESISGNRAATASAWNVEDGLIAIRPSQMGQELSGSFSDWSAEIAFDPEAPGPSMGSVTVTIGLASLSLPPVTEQVLGPGYFEVASNPTARFTADIRRDPAGPDLYFAEGKLSLKGTEADLSLPFSLTLDGDQATVAGSAEIDRRAFGIGPPQDGRTVGFMVGVDILLTATPADVP